MYGLDTIVVLKLHQHDSERCHSVLEVCVRDVISKVGMCSSSGNSLGRSGGIASCGGGVSGRGAMEGCQGGNSLLAKQKILHSWCMNE